MPITSPRRAPEAYPTAAVAEMVKRGDLAVDRPDQVHAFLLEHQGKFELGKPVQQYIAQQPTYGR